MDIVEVCSMANDLDPRVDQWYRHLDKGQRFYITQVDDDDESVEVQHYDGDLEEYTFSEWRDLDIDLSEPPEDWTGSLDLADQEDALGQEELTTTRDEREQPAQEFRREDRRRMTRGDGNRDDSGDDYGEGYIEEELMEDSDQADRGPEDNDRDSNLTLRPDGVYEETFSDSWYAEYQEDPDSGLWRADVYQEDLPEWRNGDFESIDDARVAARDYYDRV